MEKQIPNTSVAREAMMIKEAGCAFHNGTNHRCHEYLGAHKEKDGTYVFRVWAPGAKKVGLCADFTDWIDGIPMLPVTEGGVFECRVKAEQNNVEGSRYKFKITGKKETVFKCDPYAAYSEIAPRNASVVRTAFHYTFTDERFLSARKERYHVQDMKMPIPLNIYEMHLGSFLRRGDGSYASYTEIADKLVPYVRQMGYTHVELMPIMEYPKDSSLGFLATGYFAPTSRFGTPDEFASLVDRLHAAGIGVILDFVPTCFSNEEHGLLRFDTGVLYESESAPSNAEYSFFDLTRAEVKSFLISSALFWLRRFHIDGLRLVGEREDPDTLAFWQELIMTVSREFPDVLTITEMPDKMLFGKAPRTSVKWYCAWTKDVFDYITLDPMARMNHPAEMNLKNEQPLKKRFILPISHSDVSGGKRSLIERMQGSYEQKFAQMRTMFLFQMTYPGKKLSFMGNEYGQFREWTHDRELEWFMLGYDMHRRLQRFVSDLNHLYLTKKALYEKDFTSDGFERILMDGDVVAYKRYGNNGEKLVVVLSFAGSDINDLHLPVSGDYRRYRVILDTTAELYSGKHYRRQKAYETVCKDGKYYLAIPAISCSGLVLEPDPTSKQPCDQLN